jgi:hypothetical protein
MFENCEDCEKELAKCRENVSRAKEEKLSSCEKEKKQEIEKNNKLQKQLMRWTIGAAVASAVLGKELVDKITDAFSSAEKAVQSINPNSFIDNLDYGTPDNQDEKEDPIEEEEEKEEEEDKEDKDDISFIPITPDIDRGGYAKAGGWGLVDLVDFNLEYNLNDYLGIKNIIEDKISSEAIGDMLELGDLAITSFPAEYAPLDFQYPRQYLQAPPPVNVPSPGSIAVFLIYPCLGSRRRRF